MPIPFIHFWTLIFNDDKSELVEASNHEEANGKHIFTLESGQLREIEAALVKEVRYITFKPFFLG